MAYGIGERKKESGVFFLGGCSWEKFSHVSFSVDP